MSLCEVSKDPKLYNVILVLTKIFYSLNYQVITNYTYLLHNRSKLNLKLIVLLLNRIFQNFSRIICKLGFATFKSY